MKPLISGTMGEAHHLSHDERSAIIKSVRAALDDADFKEVPIIAGSGAGSTRETIQLSKAAAEAGADYAIVICSGYFAGALVNNKKALKAFWAEVSEKSPIPVIIYNCESVLYYYLTCKILSMSATTDPGAAGGIDLDSDLITELAEECPNLAGVKLTYVMSGLLCVSI